MENMQARKIMRLKYFCLTSLMMSICINTSTNAQQQLWASQYVKWKFDSSLDVWNIDQLVKIPVTSNKGFWPLQWSWRGANGAGGYMGLQQGNNSSAQQVRFSLWNAVEAKGDNCIKFDGEGVGYTCVLPITINHTEFYKLRLWRLESDKDGQWWGAWITEYKNDQKIDHAIGQIKVPLSYKVVNPDSITNFVEYYGERLSQCDQVPFSKAGFTPPAVNYKGDSTEVYGGYSTYAGSSSATENICKSGKESRGAFVTALPYDFGFAQGVMVYLGGKNKEPILSR